MLCVERVFNANFVFFWLNMEKSLAFAKMKRENCRKKLLLPTACHIKWCMFDRTVVPGVSCHQTQSPQGFAGLLRVLRLSTGDDDDDDDVALISSSLPCQSKSSRNYVFVTCSVEIGFRD